MIRLLLVFAVVLASCQGSNRYAGLKLPPTPVLTVQTYYGVVNSPYLRVRSQAASDAPEVTRLREGSIVEIVTSSTSEETVEGKTDRWYEVQYQGRRGWVFGSYLHVFDSLDKARNAAISGPETPLQTNDKK